MASFEKKRFKYFKRRPASEPISFTRYLEKVLESKGNSELRQKLFHLYDHWDMVMGEELCTLALPIGHRDKNLLIAAEDNLALNELTYLGDEILERVHAFLDEEAFEKIELHLLQSKRPLNTPFEIYSAPQNVELIRPENLGRLSLPEGKVRDAYLHYLSLFKE